MKPEKQVIAGVEKAQQVLTEYVEPRDPSSGHAERDCKDTVGKLLNVLNNEKFVEAVDEVKHKSDAKTDSSKAA